MPRKKLDNTRVHLLLPRGSYDRLKNYAEFHGYSISELMRRAVDEWLDERNWEAEK